MQGCVVCRGKGVAWDPPIAAWTALAGMKIVREWANFGEFEAGDLVATIPSDSPFYAAGESDKAAFTDSSEAFSSIVLGGVDFLPFQTVSIDRVVWKDVNTGALVNGGMPMQDTAGNLSWPNGDGPPSVVQYSISGRKVPVYYMFRDLVQDRHHSAGLPLPRRVVLRRLDLFAR